MAHLTTTAIATATCGHCANGWRCEDHPSAPAGHDGCLGASVACRDPACPAVTYIPCLGCKRPVAVATPMGQGFMFTCPACGYWDVSGFVSESHAAH